MSIIGRKVLLWWMNRGMETRGDNIETVTGHSETKEWMKIVIDRWIST